MEIKGSLVKLRPLSLDDLDNVMTWVNDPEVIKNFQNFDTPITREKELEKLDVFINGGNDKLFSIFRKSDGAYIGQCGISQISWKNFLGRLSVFIKPEFRGQGYFQEVVPLIIEHAFSELKLHKVWVMFFKTNKRMWHLCNKLGFILEADMPDEYFWNGKYHDIIRMAKINW